MQKRFLHVSRSRLAGCPLSAIPACITKILLICLNNRDGGGAAPAAQRAVLGAPTMFVESILTEVIHDHCPGVASYRLSP
jgi:hypothetical protein